MHFYEASDLSNLTYTNTFDTPNLAHRVNYARMGNTDYVFAGDLSSVVKINVNDISNLVSGGSYQQSTEAYAAAHHLGNFFMADASGNRVLALNASTMQYISEHATTFADVTGLTTMHQGKIVLVSTIGGVDAFNFENMTSPVLTDRLPLGWLYGIVGSETGSTAYAAGTTPHLINVDSAGKLSYLRSGPVMTATSGGLAVNGEDLYLAGHADGFYRYDIGGYKFEGISPNATYFRVRLTANDGHGGSVSDEFAVNVGNVLVPTNGVASSASSTTDLTSPSGALQTSGTTAQAASGVSSVTPTSGASSSGITTTSGSLTDSPAFSSPLTGSGGTEANDLLWLWIVAGVSIAVISVIVVGVYFYRQKQKVSDEVDDSSITSHTKEVVVYDDLSNVKTGDQSSFSETGEVVYTEITELVEHSNGTKSVSTYNNVFGGDGSRREDFYNNLPEDDVPDFAPR